VLLGPVASLLSAVALAGALVESPSVMVTAHRAGSALGPENSILALRRSIEAGADYVEIDVQLTSDGHVVLMHDRDLRRTTGDPRNVNDVTLAEIKQLRLRTADGASNESVPTLDEFLSACDARIRLNIELKETAGQPGLALAVVRVLGSHPFRGAGVSCFHLPPLEQIRHAETRIPVGMILSVVQGDPARLPVDFLSLNARIVRAILVRRAHQRNLEVHAWTVNDRDTARRLMELGCDNLITSDPKLMRQVVDEYAALSDVERVLHRLRRWMRE
jgi:glycerophosphoryl diester phosphodiesterase